MLFRHTVLYLPAQLLPAVCQFAALIAWSHLATPEAIGIVTLFTSVQEFINIAFIGFWNQYTVRFAGKLSATADERRRLQTTSTVVVAVSLFVQVAIGLAIYAVAIDPRVSLLTVVILAALVGGRALNLFQGERGRAQGDVLLYSVAVMSGPVLGLLLGLALLWRFGSDAFWVFLGFSVAQMAGVAFGLARDRSWIGLGRPDMGIVRHALSYGAPLIVSSVLAWVTQNASRIAVSYILGFGAVGIYALGLGLGYRASTVAAMVVTAAAFPIAVRKTNAGDMEGARRQLAVNGALLIAVLAGSLVGLALVAHDVLRVLVAANLRDAIYPVMLWSLFAGACICVRQHFFNQIFLLQGETWPIATIAIGEAIVAVALAAIAVPLAGPVGGAMALALTSLASMLVTYRAARGAGLIVPWTELARIAAATGAMTVAVLLTREAFTAGQLAIRVAAGGAAFLLTLAALHGGDLRTMMADRRRRSAT